MRCDATFFDQTHSMFAHSSTKLCDYANLVFSETTVPRHHHKNLFTAFQSVQAKTAAIKRKPKLAQSHFTTALYYFACKVFGFSVQNSVLLRIFPPFFFNLLRSSQSRRSSICYQPYILHLCSHLCFRLHESSVGVRRLSQKKDTWEN